MKTLTKTMIIIALTMQLCINSMAQIKPNYSRLYKNSFAKPKSYAIDKVSFKYEKGDFWAWFDKQPKLVKSAPTIAFNTTMFFMANTVMNKAGRTQDPVLRDTYRGKYDKIVFTWVASIPLQFIYTKVMIWDREGKKQKKIIKTYYR